MKISLFVAERKGTLTKSPPCVENAEFPRRCLTSPYRAYSQYLFIGVSTLRLWTQQRDLHEGSLYRRHDVFPDADV